MSSSVVSSDCHGYTLHVPQRPYQPQRMVYQGEPLEHPTAFFVDGSSGISVRDALEENFSGLRGSYDQIFLNNGSSISLRFEWPGYGSYTCQIRTKDWRKNPRSITRAKLANRVAKELQRYITLVDGDTDVEEDDLRRRWRLGRGFIDVDRLVLVRLDHVSKASYQPQFRLAY